MVSEIKLESYDSFIEHPWITPLREKYRTHDNILAYYAIAKLGRDLNDIKEEYFNNNGRDIIVSIEGRVKEEVSLFGKLYNMCKNRDSSKLLTKESIEDMYVEINDIASVRYACPYNDQIPTSIKELVRPGLLARGYAVNLNTNLGLADVDNLDEGNEHGYRTYHFFVNIPTPTTVFGDAEPCLCEIQVRTELQHIWAVKSHD